MNFEPGSVDPNVALAEVDQSGAVCFENSEHATVHFVGDHLGSIDGDAFVSARASGGGVRVVDTRDGLGGSSMVPSQRLCFEVAGAPGDGAIVNLTPLNAERPGSGLLISSDVTAPPVASNVNFGPGSIDPNVAIAPIGRDGRVCFVNSEHGSVDLVADHLGTVVSTAYTSATTSGAPVRLIDTRRGLGGERVAPSERLCFAIDGDPGDAVLVNLTPVNAAGPGSGQLISSAVLGAPTASNVNFGVGSVDPNVAIAPIGPDGKVCYLNSEHHSVDLVADVLGTLTALTYLTATPSGSSIRVADTRLTAAPRDLVLRATGVGLVDLNTSEPEARRYVDSGLGDPVSVETAFFPDQLASGIRINFNTEAVFTFAVGREACYARGFCLVFGGESPGDLRLVGWFHVEPSRGRSLTTADGVGVRSVLSNFPRSVLSYDNRCILAGYGTTRGIQVRYRTRSGQDFLDFVGGQLVDRNVPDSDISVRLLFTGDLMMSAHLDCGDTRPFGS